MKKKYYYFLSFCLAFLFIGCGDDDDNGVKITEIELEKDEVVAYIDEDVVTCRILSGGGKYKLTNKNKELFEASLDDDNVISIQGITPGEGKLVVTDQQSNTKDLIVKVGHKEILIDEAYKDIKVEITPGESKTVKFEILKGSGGYTAKAEPEGVVEIKIEKSQVEITNLVSEGKAKIEIKDFLGNKLDLMYEVAPKKEEDGSLDEIIEKALSYNEPTYYHDGKTLPALQPINEKLGDMDVYGCIGSAGEKFMVAFSGGLSEGVKPGSIFGYRSTSAQIETPLDHFEIIKSEDTMFWGVFQYKDNEGAAKYGFIVAPVSKKEEDGSLEEIKDKALNYNEPTYYHDGEIMSSPFETAHEVKDGKDVYGCMSQQTGEVFMVTFGGGTSKGIKEEAMFVYMTMSAGGPVPKVQALLDHFEIIKNDNNMFWAVFQYKDEEGVTKYGFVVDQVAKEEDGSLEEIKDKALSYNEFTFYHDDKVIPVLQPINRKQEDMDIYGCISSTGEVFMIAFGGGLSKGVKPGSIFAYQSASGTEKNNLLDHFEIIKNDNNMFWAVFHYKEEGVTKYGFIVSPIE